MQLYYYEGAPSPRKVLFCLHEKGVEVELKRVDIRAGEQFQDWFRDISPAATVPVLLDDKLRLCESEAICRYFDCLGDGPSLFGDKPRHAAVITEWLRRIDAEGYSACAEIFRNSASPLQDRALAAPFAVAQIPALAERGRLRLPHFLAALDAQLQSGQWLAGESFSMADIAALTCCDFAERLDFEISNAYPALDVWRQRVWARPAGIWLKSL